jgi:succinate dehydrogenase / fumarate reductase iron-sulfur subunit
MNLVLHVWRQKNAKDPGRMQRIEAKDISEHMSFLEMLDVVNERLIAQGEDPIAFDHDCREGICGMCGMMINGVPHGPKSATTACQLHMRTFQDGQTIVIEPWRARAFPVLKDLVVDRTAFDRIVAAGGFISVSTGSAPDGNAIPVPKESADRSMDAASCIACGACVAACPNASAMLFTGAKLSHLNVLPQGQPERFTRVQAMVAQMDKEGFGHCTGVGECSSVCPKEIPLEVIAQTNRDLIKAALVARPPRAKTDDGA